MRKFVLGTVILSIIAGLTLAAFLFISSVANAREESPDVLVTFGCFQEQTALDLAHVWKEKGEYYFNEIADAYLQTNECFLLYEPGYPAYIDRMVKEINKLFLGDRSYVVEAHMYGSPPVGDEDYKPFYFLFHGELPERAVRREAL